MEKLQLEKKISEDKTKKQALKSVQRLLVNIIWRIMKDGRDYTDYTNTAPAPASSKVTNENVQKAGKTEH